MIVGSVNHLNSDHSKFIHTLFILQSRGYLQTISKNHVKEDHSKYEKQSLQTGR
ncbi:unnamed protein product [Hymenolepis diminuta]|uniref:Uncharacterized protein n=1 Tax=Hymenolepis diminuta TaxID=6216 RepID=A0A564Z6K2_HYMDI|nr:unnamed protein product [Hymenolepis diminuta]